MQKKLLIAIFLQLCFGSWAQTRTSASLRPQAPCPATVTITGPYTTTYTNANNWIASSGTTTVPSGAVVTLDANPATDGYITLNPGFSAQPGSDFLAVILTPCELINPLPVKLINFDAKPNDKTVTLTWATSIETNSLGFEIERSENGKEFEKIGFVKSDTNEGNSNEKLSYEYIDNLPVEGNNYYRLKQLDLDGKSAYSPIKSAQFDGENAINIFPNPTSDFITITANDHSKIKNIELISAKGTILYRSKIIENKIDISTQPTGMYFLKIENVNGKVTLKKVLKN
jgi:trimeric autotransporter adhesin